MDNVERIAKYEKSSMKQCQIFLIWILSKINYTKAMLHNELKHKLFHQISS